MQQVRQGFILSRLTSFPASLAAGLACVFARLCGLADEIARSRIVTGAEAAFFSNLPVRFEAVTRLLQVAPWPDRRRAETAFRFFARMGRRRAAVLLLLALSFAGCAGSLPAAFSPPGGGARLANVPFFPQLDFQCGPASLAGVLNYYGKRITPEEIAQAIFRENIRGTVTLDMVLYAREQGLSAIWFSGSVDEIVEAINNGSPLIVMVDYGFSVVSHNHYMVVVGYDPKGIVANSGTSRETHILWSDFLPIWERAKRWTLRIEPKNG